LLRVWVKSLIFRRSCMFSMWMGLFCSPIADSSDQFLSRKLAWHSGLHIEALDNRINFSRDS
jgi:hypothetical protein